MPRKNPAAVALGRRGGRAKTEAQDAARRRNGPLGGRPQTYRLLADGTLHRRVGTAWVRLEPPYDSAALAYLRRHRVPASSQ